MGTNPTDIQKRIDEERKERERKAREALESQVNTGLFGLPVPGLSGIFGAPGEIDTTVDLTPEVLEAVAPKPVTGSARPLLVGEDQLLIDRALNPDKYPNFAKGLEDVGLNPTFVQNVAKGKVPGTSIMDINERFMKQSGKVNDNPFYSLKELVRDTTEVDFASAAQAVPGTNIFGTVTSPVLGDIYPSVKDDLLLGPKFDTTQALGLLSNVFLMQSLLDNKPQAPAASAPRGIAGSRLPEEDPFKRRF